MVAVVAPSFAPRTGPPRRQLRVVPARSAPASAPPRSAPPRSAPVVYARQLRVVPARLASAQSAARPSAPVVYARQPGVGPARLVPARLVPARPVPARLAPERSAPVVHGRQLGGRPRARLAPAVYRRRRIMVLGLMAVLVALVWSGIRGLVDGSTTGLPATRPISVRVWVVRPGDTLWSIALASGDKGDIRPLVDELSAEVHGEPLQVGQRILLP